MLSVTAFGGTARVSGLRLIRELETMGAQISSSSDREKVIFHLDSPETANQRTDAFNDKNSSSQKDARQGCSHPINFTVTQHNLSICDKDHNRKGEFSNEQLKLF